MQYDLAIFAALAVAGLALIRTQRLQDEAEQGAGALFSLGLANLAEELRRPFEGDPPAGWQANQAAFLMMIRHAEGTAGPLGYSTMFGGGQFTGWADHPRVAHRFRDLAGRWLWTTAAGAYQAMAVSPLPDGRTTKVDTWDRIKRKHKLPDFSPASQDAFALALIDEAGALSDVRAGRVEAAISKVRGIWASLPGAGYAQPEKGLPELLAAYQRAGGAVA